MVNEKQAELRPKGVEREESDSWMQGLGIISDELPESRGTVVKMKEPASIETRFGMRKMMQVEVKGSDDSVASVQVFLPQQFPMIHPKSNLAKIMYYYGCKELQELLGKEVELIRVGQSMWKIKCE